MPHREVIDGVLVVFGGAFLITPGLPHRHRRPPAADPAHPRADPAASSRAGSASAWRSGLSPDRGAARGPGAGATSTSRARATRVRRPVQEARGGERARARALVLRPRPRDLRDGASGRDDPVRGRGAPRPCGGASIERAGRRRLARANSTDELALDAERGLGARPTWAASAPSSCACAARPPGAESTASARSPRPQTRAALGGARRPAHGVGDRRRRARAARARPPPARRARATARSAWARCCSTTGASCEVDEARALDRLRRRRPPAQRRPRAVAAAARSSRAAARGRGGRARRSQLEEVEVHAAVFRWRLDGRDGIGGYELMARTEPPAAA